MKRSRLIAAGTVAVSVAMVAAVSVAAQTPDLRWRVRVVVDKLTGRLPEIPGSDLVRWLRPDSPVYLGRLADTPSLHAAITNLRTGAAAEERGRALFGSRCATCHGDDARGRNGPDLIASVGALSDWSFFATIKWGRAGTAMAAQGLDDVAIWDVHAFVRREALAAVEPARPVAAVTWEPAAEVPYLESAATDWLTHAGNHAGHRHSGLAQVMPSSVGRLQLAWAAQLRSNATPMQATPIIAGGRMFVTESHEGVVALDAATGARLWHFRRALPDNLPLCCGSPNRGAAILGRTVFVGSLDAQLLAIDAETGRLKWAVKVAEPAAGYSMTGAPLAFGNTVVVGVAGSIFGARGLLAAYAADDGRELWRFYTVPGPGDAGHETWSGESWKTGGATTWTTGAYDAENDLVYWGVGNPAPIFNGDGRAGDNLFANSVIVLDAKTGRRKWHFQFTPHDEHDWDSTQQPILTTTVVGSEKRARLLWANRNAFFYAFDRSSGTFLSAKPFAKQTWAEGIDAQGRPILKAGAAPTEKGTLVWPAVGGATSWWPPSYDPQRGLVFVPAVDAASLYFKGGRDFERGTPFLSGSTKFASNQPVWAGLRAIDAATGAVRWQATFKQGEDVLRVVGGVLSTATGVVFAGHEDRFYAVAADDGRLLWDVRLGARVSGSPVSYAVNGQQYVAVAAGSSVFAFRLAPAAQVTARKIAR
jgi:alcohol dehydrogenase (cytochrome c)